MTWREDQMSFSVPGRMIEVSSTWLYQEREHG